MKYLHTNYCTCHLNRALLLFSPSAVGDFSPFGSAIATFSVGGPTTNCIDFNITDDEELEGDHDFTVEITDISSIPPHAIIGSSSINVVTITDNEGT